MDRIEIPNVATYSPIALSDILVAAPLASRLLLGATLPGRVLQAAAFGYYAGSALRDWTARKGMRRVDFLEEFGADVTELRKTPEEERLAEVAELATLLNENKVEGSMPRDELATTVNEHLTGYIASITGQRVETSSEVRGTTLTGLLFPFAYGACDMLSGDIAIFKDTGIFEPHILTHEFCHRKGYMKELHAQVLAYMALRHSGDPRLVQSARAERLNRQLQVLAGDDPGRYHELIDETDLDDDFRKAFHDMRPTTQAVGGFAKVMRSIYDERMRMTGQNGLSDYWEGFTDFLYTFRTADGTRQSKEQTAV